MLSIIISIINTVGALWVITNSTLVYDSTLIVA